MQIIEGGHGMRIGLLITSVGNFGQKGFYNAQEIGLAKELDKLFDEVVVYKAVPLSVRKSKSLIDGCEHSTLCQVPVKSHGINGEWDCSIMDTTLDALIYFSDTQLAVPKVLKWCCQNNIQMYPYIGVIESHSTNKWKKYIIDVLFKRNVAVYKKCTCFVKTPTVAEQLGALGITKTVVTPVGLDISLLHADYEKFSAEGIKEKYGYSVADKVLLFIGRFTEEKQPIRMIEILSDIRKKDQAYKLLMVGTGELKEDVKAETKHLDLADSVQMIERIPNNEIWELYRFAAAFINLNQQEIFGMAILEAMYYGCKVVAWKAPGPNFIITNNVTGYLANSNESVIEAIEAEHNVSEAAHQCILQRFTWNASANRMRKVIEGN